MTRFSSVETARGVVLPRREQRPAVVELELAQEPVGVRAPVLPGGAQGQAGPGRGVDLLQLERLDQLRGGEAGLGQDPARA